MKKIGFVGVGIMGKSMVRNLIKQGYEVTIYNRTKSKVEDVLKEGVKWAQSAGECAKDKEVVITMVGYPKDVEEVYFGHGGILDQAMPSAYLIDMTTTSPQLSIRIHEEAKKRGLHSIDAPVTGGDSGAKNAALTILVGGEKEDYNTCLPIFKAMGRNIVYQGCSGSGQHAKMANQIAIAGALSGVCEAFTYAKRQGLDQETVFQAISQGAAGSSQMEQLAPKMFRGDFEPGFFMKHFIKDMKIAMECAKEKGLDLGVLQQVLSMCDELADEGKGNLGTQSLIQYYQKDKQDDWV
ncbi:MAG TPA: NAD(P)-dependent oxidoreductase [Candidatus Merdenecus merdavium]|nr:NAD(P)-dependent oxidoreductase [Candidatus Merdenecus merdavium]